MMCSLELTTEVLETRQSEGFRLHAQHPHHAWLRWGLLSGLARLLRENVYHFYSAADKLHLVEAQVRHSVRSGDGPAAASGLTDCYTICFAAKREADTLYFRGSPPVRRGPRSSRCGHRSPTC